MHFNVHPAHLPVEKITMSVRRWSITVTACLLLVIALAGFKYLQIRKLIAFAESFPEPSETVEPYTVTTSNWHNITTTVGEVKVPQTVVLRNEVEGRVTAVGFAPGERVNKDQMLLQLDASEEIAQLRAAEADAELAGQTLARNEKMIRQQLSSREQYDQARTQRAVALAQAEALRAVIAKKTVTAPFAAQAGLHSLQVGQFLAANTVITQLVGEQASVWVDFALPQQLASLPAGALVQVSLRGLVGEPLTGSVTATDPMVSPTSRNLMLRATVENRDNHLKPGMLVDVAVETSATQTVLVVPDTAVLFDHVGSYVFELAKDDKGALRAKRRTVATGGAKSGLMMITSGVQAGELIAGNGAYKLQDGQLAYLKDKGPISKGTAE
jgi:membrane fusion protein (multidrug efflux system)